MQQLLHRVRFCFHCDFKLHLLLSVIDAGHSSSFETVPAMFPEGLGSASSATLVENPHYGSSFGSYQSFRESRNAKLSTLRSTEVDAPYDMPNRQTNRGYDGDNSGTMVGMDTRTPARSVNANRNMPNSFGNPTYEFAGKQGIYSTVEELV